mgnify:CR=1 FL=1
MVLLSLFELVVVVLEVAVLFGSVAVLVLLALSLGAGGSALDFGLD